MHTRDLAARFEAYGHWRRRLSAAISALHGWLDEQELTDAQVDSKVQQILERLHQDRLVVAFVAEFSRGKSELINAIFFADFGQRLLPSAAGRTTMCPTELLHDESDPPSIRLLPIETRQKEGTVAEFKHYADEWTTFPLDLSSAERMGEALAHVSDVTRVPVEIARRYGLCDDGPDDDAAVGAADGTVEIPCWRHAIINFPHPLLQQGLVILDTPGLNAIGTEPELTLSLLPNAHAVLFILAADAGVTKTDLDVWTRHLDGDEAPARSGRLVILNKIDGLWDDLKPRTAIDDEIERQVEATASMLGVPRAQVYPVSAQKALVAKVNGDDALLDARAQGVGEQLAELCALRGKNQDVVLHMLDRTREEKERFERGLARFTALRTVFTNQTNRLFDEIGLESLRGHATRTRKAIEASPFTRGVRGAMNDFFAAIFEDVARAGQVSAEIHEMMQGMYARFAAEQGITPFVPPPFSVLKYRKEVERLERAYNRHFNTLWNMVSKAKFALMKRFYETIAARAKHLYEVANRDADAWLRAVMAPLETQVREHHLQLKRRLDSIRRIHAASDELEERIAELEQQARAIDVQVRALDRRLRGIDALVEQDEPLPAAANG